jgi:hypothetical protein
MILAVILTGSLLLATASSAGIRVGLRSYDTTHSADVRVWMDGDRTGDDYYNDDQYYDDDYDVYPSVHDVRLHIRASRDCYATVFAIDTDGYIHVLHPLSPYDDAYLIGGRTYSFLFSDLGFAGLAFDRGIAFVYAVTSPYPFRYTRYGRAVFGASFGFRIYGDPFIAAKQFYLSLMPGWCDRGLIGISYSRFYVREYVRYPSYLCAGWHDHYGSRRLCRGDCSAYRHYRVHSSDPYRVIHPKRKLKREYSRYTRISPAAKGKIRDGVRSKVQKTTLRREGQRVQGKSGLHSVRKKNAVYEKNKAVKTSVKKTTTRKIARSSKETFVRGKKDYSSMRKHPAKASGSRAGMKAKTSKRVLPRSDAKVNSSKRTVSRSSMKVNSPKRTRAKVQKQESRKRSGRTVISKKQKTKRESVEKAKKRSKR